MNVSRLELIKIISQRLLTREITDPKQVGMAIAVINRIARCTPGWIEKHLELVGLYAGLDFRFKPWAIRPDFKNIIAPAVAKDKAFLSRIPKSPSKNKKKRR